MRRVRLWVCGSNYDHNEGTQVVMKAFNWVDIREHRYSILVGSSRDQRAYYSCSKGGKYQDKSKDLSVHESRQRKNTNTMKNMRLWKAVAKKCLNQAGFQLQIIDNTHNHGLVVSLSALPKHKIAAMTLEERAKIKEEHTLGYSPSQILRAIRRNSNFALILRDIYNLLASLRIKELNSQTLV